MEVMVAGGSGLVGSHLLFWLGEDAKIRRIHSFSRRPLPSPAAGKPQSRLEEHVAADLGLGSLDGAFAADAAFCCLGTTIKKAGSQTAFQAIDRDLVLNFGIAARKAGCAQFHLVSSLGADPDSRNFYLRTKGEAEAGLAELGFPALHIYRPSLLLGARTEKRWAEQLSSKAYARVQAYMPRFLDTYRPIEARALARFMQGKLGSPEQGLMVWENLAMHRALEPA